MVRAGNLHGNGRTGSVILRVAVILHRQGECVFHILHGIEGIRPQRVQGGRIRHIGVGILSVHAHGQGQGAVVTVQYHGFVTDILRDGVLRTLPCEGQRVAPVHIRHHAVAVDGRPCVAVLGCACHLHGMAGIAADGGCVIGAGNGDGDGHGVIRVHFFAIVLQFIQGLAVQHHREFQRYGFPCRQLLHGILLIEQRVGVFAADGVHGQIAVLVCHGLHLLAASRHAKAQLAPLIVTVH